MKNELLQISEIVPKFKKKKVITWHSHCTNYNTTTPKETHSFILSLT